jgi:hypothetical protein
MVVGGVHRHSCGVRRSGCYRSGGESLMGQIGDLITHLANKEQDRAIEAVLDSLKEMGVMCYNPERACYRFTECEVSGETLAMRITRHLSRF